MNRWIHSGQGSSVHLIYHDPSDLGSLILMRIILKERTPRQFWILDFTSKISRIPYSTNKNFPESGIQIPLHGVSREFLRLLMIFTSGVPRSLPITSSILVQTYTLKMSRGQDAVVHIREERAVVRGVEVAKKTVIAATDGGWDAMPPEFFNLYCRTRSTA